jgi:flagellar hook-associated protein 3 FlgL
MTLSISTYGLYNSVLGAAKTVQKAEATASLQESTGLVGTSFGDYGSKSRQLLSLQNERNLAQSWSDNIALASDRSQATYSAIGDMITLLTSLRTTISSAMSGTATSTLNSQGTTTLEDLAGKLNTALDGRYLFAGSQSDQPAVDLASYEATTASASTADASYYQGDAQKATVRVSSATTVTYGVTADETGAEKALRAAKLVAQLTTEPLDTSTLGSAYDLADDAINDLSNLRASISVTSNRLDDAKQSEATYISLLEDATSAIKNVDSAQALANVKLLDTQLQASYSALSVVLKIKLTDYL